MSQRNGDRSRFNRLRKRKISLRKSIRNLRSTRADALQAAAERVGKS
jgi:hypothetical protein